jgi:hypothetical protein
MENMIHTNDSGANIFYIKNHILIHVNMTNQEVNTGKQHIHMERIKLTNYRHIVEREY